MYVIEAKIKSKCDFDMEKLQLHCKRAKVADEAAIVYASNATCCTNKVFYKKKHIHYYTCLNRYFCSTPAGSIHASRHSLLTRGRWCAAYFVQLAATGALTNC